MNIWKWS